jgi:hypothetical protein
MRASGPEFLCLRIEAGRAWWMPDYDLCCPAAGISLPQHQGGNSLSFQTKSALWARPRRIESATSGASLKCTIP